MLSLFAQMLCRNNITSVLSPTIAHRLMMSSHACFTNVPFTESSGLKIRNKLLGKCLQVQGDTLGGTVSLGECNPHSPLQEWRWLPESQALSSPHTGECLTAPGEQHEAVHLQPCIPSDGRSVVDVGSEASSQAWSCSRKGHLTLMAKGLLLSATQQSTLILLSRENNQVM